MAVIPTEFLLISANIGSTFDYPDRLFPIWIENVIEVIERFKPIFIAIHCQEVGGKNYEESMQYLDTFMKLLLTNAMLVNYTRARIYLDDDITVEETFTALGSLYFIHESVDVVEQWDFIKQEFISVSGREIFSANIDNISHKFKEKYPLKFFPELKWSRKGFMQTRWRILNQTIDFVNIHLFHDICNLSPIIKNQRIYADNRKLALEYTVKKITKNFTSTIPLFVFGDFNFRLNTEKLIKNIIEPNSTLENIYKKTSQGAKTEEIIKIVYKSVADNSTTCSVNALHDSKKDVPIGLPDDVKNKSKCQHTMLEVARKLFDMAETKLSFISDQEKFREYDEEHGIIEDHLQEFKVNFPPSYPFSEEDNKPNEYMKTRCPSWCDRIFLNHHAMDMVDPNSSEYNMIGLGSCVGDHKPIFLSFNRKIERTLPDNDKYINNNNIPGEHLVDQKVVSDNNDISITLPTPPPLLMKTTNQIKLNGEVTNQNGETNRKLISMDSVDTGAPHFPQHRSAFAKRYSVVDSINGIRAAAAIAAAATNNKSKPISNSTVNSDWNIFDNARFEKEQVLELGFRRQHRLYSHTVTTAGGNEESSDMRGADNNNAHKFMNTAHNMTLVSSVLSAFTAAGSMARRRKISESSSSSCGENEVAADMADKLNVDDAEATTTAAAKGGCGDGSKSWPVSGTDIEVMIETKKLKKEECQKSIESDNKKCPNSVSSASVSVGYGKAAAINLSRHKYKCCSLS